MTRIVLLYYERSDVNEVLIAGGAVDISMLKFESDASFQNTAEFIAAVLGIRGLRQLGTQPESVCRRGDSITALTWASTGKFRGEVVGNAAAEFVLQNLYAIRTSGSTMLLSRIVRCRSLPELFLT